MANLFDNLLAIRILKMLVTPFEESDAFKSGIIDKRGHALKKFTDLTFDEKEKYSLLDRMVFSLKRIINKTPGGENKIKNFVAAYWLIKENYGSIVPERRLETLFEEAICSITEEQNNEVVSLFEEMGAAPTNGVAGAAVTEPVVKKSAAKKYKNSNIIKRNLQNRVSFKEYLDYNIHTDSLNEGTGMNMVEIQTEIEKFHQAGSIAKRDYDTLKSKFARLIDKEYEHEVEAPYHWGKGQENSQNPNSEIGELSWIKAGNHLEVLSMKNKLAKLKNPATKSHPMYHATQSFYNKYAPICQKFKELKDMIVTATQERAIKKEVQSVEKKRVEAKNHSLIAALNLHREEYIKAAGERAKANFDGMMEKLAKHDWDLDIMHPVPQMKLSWNKRDYDNQHSIDIARQRYFAITDGNGAIRKYSHQKENEYIEMNKRGAAASYDEYVHKMIQKIGKQVTHADITGSPWTGSTLKVKTEDGEDQVWSTKMILNFSKYQTMFNQFPSRRIK